jgi:hypothetical protein
MRVFILCIGLSMVASCDSETKIHFESKRVERSAAFTVKAPVEEAFPLFGPIKEKLWAAGWEPEIIYSESKDVEQHMIFRTNNKHGESENYQWIITQYQPDQFLIEYTVSTSQRVWFITVKCEAAGRETKATVTYSYTGLTEEGNKLNENALNKMYAHNLSDWEEAVNYYIETGKQMTE